MPVVRGQPPEPVSGIPDSPPPRDFAFTLRLHRVESLPPDHLGTHRTSPTPAGQGPVQVCQQVLGRGLT